jgi:hypothetical protein
MVQDHLKVFTEDGVRKVLNTDTGKVYEDVVTLTTNLDDPGCSQNGSVIRLGTLYDFARKHQKHAEDAIRLEGSRFGRDYCRLCENLTKDVDERKGFYLWGVFDRKRYWHSIYLGKAGFGKTANLKNRICEELKDERPFLWRAFLDESQLFRIRDRIHPGRNYTWRRQLKKWGATHIVWASAERVEDSAIRLIEADLIEALDPIANMQRPTPPSKHQRDAAAIFEMFRHHIHDVRHDKAVLSKFQEEELLGHLGRL